MSVIITELNGESKSSASLRIEYVEIYYIVLSARMHMKPSRGKPKETKAPIPNY